MPTVRTGATDQLFPFTIPEAELWDTTSYYRAAVGNMTAGGGFEGRAFRLPGIQGTTVIGSDSYGPLYSHKPVVGQGTPFPIGLTLQQLVKWYWRIKSWYINGTSVTHDSDGSTGSSSITNILMLSGLNPNSGVEANPKLEVRQVLPTAQSVDGADIAQTFIFSDYDIGNVSKTPRCVTYNDLYYPSMFFLDGYTLVALPTVNAQIEEPRVTGVVPGWEGLGGNFSDIFDSGLTTLDATSSVTLVGNDIHIENTTHSTNTVGTGSSGSSSASIVVSPHEYWSYDGLYDPATGDRLL